MEFFNGQFVYRRTTAHGEEYKFLSPAAVYEAFRNAPVDSGWLASGVVRCGGGARGDFAVQFIPAMRHKLNIERGALLQETPVYLPSLVFFGIGSNFYCWAVKSSSLQPTAALFHAPLPNVFESGGICWGQNTPPKAGASTIAQAWTLFIASPFNGHAASAKARNHAKDVRTLLWKLARSKAKFPHAELMSARHNLDSQINSLIGGDGDEY